MSEKSGARAEVPILAAGPEATHLASLGSPRRWSRLQKRGCARTGRPGTHSSTLPAPGCWASGWLTAPGAQHRATAGVCFGLSLPQWSPQPPQLSRVSSHTLCSSSPESQAVIVALLEPQDSMHGQGGGHSISPFRSLALISVPAASMPHPGLLPVSWLSPHSHHTLPS